MFHFYNVCFGMISCDCNTAFSIHFVICLYKIFVGLFVLMLCLFKQRFSSCIFWLQLQGSSWFLIGRSMFLLWLIIIWEIFPMQLYLTLTELWLNIYATCRFLENVYLIALAKLWWRLWQHLLCRAGYTKLSYVSFVCYLCCFCCYFLYCWCCCCFLCIKFCFYSLNCLTSFVNLWSCQKCFYCRSFSTVNRLLNLVNVWLYLVGDLKKHLCNWDYCSVFCTVEMSLWLI